MDEFDSDMVKEELDREFPNGVSGPPATSHKMVTINTNVHGSDMGNHNNMQNRSPGNRSTNSTVNTFSSNTVKHHIEEVRIHPLCSTLSATRSAVVIHISTHTT